MDVGEVLLGHDPDSLSKARRRVNHTWPAIIGFAVGCGVGAVCEAAFRLWSSGAARGPCFARASPRSYFQARGNDRVGGAICAGVLAGKVEPLRLLRCAHSAILAGGRLRLSQVASSLRKDLGKSPFRPIGWKNPAFCRLRPPFLYSPGDHPGVRLRPAYGGAASIGPRFLIGHDRSGHDLSTALTYEHAAVPPIAMSKLAGRVPTMSVSRSSRGDEMRIGLFIPCYRRCLLSGSRHRDTRAAGAVRARGRLSARPNLLRAADGEQRLQRRRRRHRGPVREQFLRLRLCGRALRAAASIMCATISTRSSRQRRSSEFARAPYELVEFLHDILKVEAFPWAGFRTASGSTTIAARCAG